MSRKRKSDNDSTEPAIPTETATAVAEPPPAEAKPDGQSFADRVGQKKRATAPDPYSIAKDYVAGVELFDSKQDRQVAIKFGMGRPEDKPSQAVIDTMKEARFRWNPQHKIWVHPLTPDSAMSVRIDAERLFQDVCKMVRHDKGIEAAPEVPF